MAGTTPWSDLPRDLGNTMRPHLARIVDEVVSSIPRDVPSYARPLEGAFGDGVRRGVQVALGRFLDLPGTSDPALSGRARDVYQALGRGELRQGRTMEALLAAYRAGARVAFRSFATLAREGGLEPDLLMPLAESVFAYIDELSAASVEGFAAEQSARAGEIDRRRSHALALLLSGTADALAAADAAANAGWVLPDAVVAVTVPADRAEGLATRLGPEVLVAPYAVASALSVVALVPAPARPAAREALTRALAGRGAAVGPARPSVAAAASLRLAVLAAGLLERGQLEGDPVWVDENLAAMVVQRDPDLVATLAEVRLAPLAALRETTRGRLAETLLAWLQHRGERQHVAAALHVHPQTVGYRLGQLKELFGPQLDDPQVRFELELALRANAPTASPG